MNPTARIEKHPNFDTTLKVLLKWTKEWIAQEEDPIKKRILQGLVLAIQILTQEDN